MYIRNYHRKKTLFTDPTMLKGWEDVFATADKAEVEEDCQMSGIEYSWGNKDKLRLINKAAAVETHPVTGDKIWFNHANVRTCIHIIVLHTCHIDEAAIGLVCFSLLFSLRILSL